MSDTLNELQTWLQNHKPTAILSYPVPLLGEGGSCSIFGELDDTPFDLTAVLTPSQIALTTTVQSIVDWVKLKTNVDWFGVYLKRSNNDGSEVLTKLAYYGEPSRAEFPLTNEFAQISNNSFVGLNGEKRTINNVKAYVANGGEYYTCDPKVQSELCWPILSPNNLINGDKETGCNNAIVGIIDAESFNTDAFNDDNIVIFEAVCQELGKLFTNH